ncbi:MAG: respiratory nitrate reductase subunit gamma [Thermodesulfobacteriota bacterium]
MDTISYIILVPMVYLAIAVCLGGIVIRLAILIRRPKQTSTLMVYPAKKPAWAYTLYDTFLLPSVRKHTPVLWVFLMAFHVCLLLLLLGHLELIGDFRPLWFYDHEIFLGGGFVGLILAICLIFFLFRRFHSPVREISVPEDYYLLLLLLLVVVFGAEMDWARNWYGYGEMTPDDYREYLGSLIRFAPELPYAVTASGHRFMLVLHVLLANLFLMVLPFTKIMHAFLALPVNKLRRG